MSNILVNASAASEGGALTILNAFLNDKYNSDDKYYVLSPLEPESKCDNIIWVKTVTSGFGTYFFSLISAYFYFIYFRCEKCISFNNINFIFSGDKVTYFHNLLILNGNNVKFKVLKFTLRFLNQKKSKFIFQTSFVKNEFELNIGYETDAKICWPGVSIPTLNDAGKTDSKGGYAYDLVVPIIDINMHHKNFKLVVEIALKVKSLKISIPCIKPDNDFYPSNISFMGRKNREDLLRCIDSADGVLITSNVETVCLPIFESIALGKRAFVLNKPYLKGIIEMFGEIDGLLPYSSIDELEHHFSCIEKSKCINSDLNFKLGDWEF